MPNQRQSTISFLRDHMPWLVLLGSLLVAASVAWGMMKSNLGDLRSTVGNNMETIKSLQETDSRHNTDIMLLHTKLDQQDEKLTLILERLDERFSRSREERSEMQSKIDALGEDVSRLIYYNDWKQFDEDGGKKP